MIAACPKCGARYRIERERLHAGSVRLRCARCEAVFRVRPPEAPESAAAPAPPAAVEPKPSVPSPSAALEESPPAAPAVAPAPDPKPAGELVLVAMPDGELAQRTVELLEQRGLRVLRAGDGVEAMLEIQRKLPRAIVLAADLPKMYGFQICEVVKRNESLRGIWVVLVGVIHHRDRYRRAPGELYGADAYVEGPDLPAGLLPLLAQGGVSLASLVPPPSRAAAPASPLPAQPAPAPSAVARAPQPPTPRAAEPARPSPTSRPPAAGSPDDSARVPLAARPPAAGSLDDSARVPLAARPPAAGLRRPAQAVAAAAPASRRGDGLDEERAKAERLARIVVSDIVLYNEERFAASARSGNVLEAMAADLAEGRQLFEERIDARVRAERDHLKDELLRRAQGRGTR